MVVLLFATTNLVQFILQQFSRYELLLLIKAYILNYRTILQNRFRKSKAFIKKESTETYLKSI